MRRLRTRALLASLLTLACGNGVCASATRGPPPAVVDTSIDIDALAGGPPVNPRVLGTNVQWVYGGDDLLVPGTLKFDPAMLSLARTMGPTVLRYPGGDQADVYDWTQGIGPLAARGPNRMAPSHQTQMTMMGSGELLSLAQNLGAAALFSVNVVTGTAAGAAAWVKQTNVTGLRDDAGRRLPKVAYWEIGNEPYFPNPDGSHPSVCELDPSTYSTRINAFAAAMRAVDPTIAIGIALAPDSQNGIAFVSPGCRGFSITVLEGLTQPIDFISVHDAYLPYDTSGRDHAASDEFGAAMASVQSLQAGLSAMRGLLRQFPATASLPFAITEYNASFSLNPASAYVHSMASPMGALYVADVMRTLAGRDDILMANTWSLSANDHWGAIHGATAAGGPYGRPTFEVFRLFGETLHGTRLPAAVTCPTFDSPGLGFSAAARGLPLITTLVTRSTAADDARTLRVLVINKDRVAAHVAAVRVAHAGISSVHARSLTTADVLSTDDSPGLFTRSEADPVASALSAFPLPPHSITLLTLKLKLAPASR
jgi:alpha-N-arabinofuranosidase